MRLLEHFELEDPIECDECGYLFDLRFWRVVSDKIMLCADRNCRKVHLVEDVIAEQGDRS